MEGRRVKFQNTSGAWLEEGKERKACGMAHWPKKNEYVD